MPPPTPTAESGTYRPYTKSAGVEPLPGYTLLQPLGRGGFGEVWKCEAPGGLHKAVKFVASDPDAENGGEQLRQEFEAFQQIKQIRHPFLLTLERVEMVGHELVMVMELADQQLQDRFRECTNARLAGIPRDELLGYLADAAEALDIIGAKYNLQHLDVKPANLFLISGHVKVGDYGLVSPSNGGGSNRGLTPRYVAPEVLRGQIHARSDQYSLALVYHELLTGSFPYSARTPQQMMLQHVTVPPDLSTLPLGDQPVVAKALSKKPEDRHGSCMAFVRALMLAVNPDIAARQARLDRTQADLFASEVDPHAGTARYPRPEDPSQATDRHPPPPYPQSRSQQQPKPADSASISRQTAARAATEPTQNHTLRSLPPLTVTGRDALRGGPLPPLISASRRAAGMTETPPPQKQATISSPLEDELPEAAPIARVNPIRSVIPARALTGHLSESTRYAPADFIQAVLAHAVAGGRLPQMPGDIGRLNDGTWVSQFPSTVPASVIPHKVAVLHDVWGLSVEQPDATRIVLRKTASTGLWGSLSGKKSGLEVMVRIPKGNSAGEVTVTGTTFGTPDPSFARTAADVLPKIIADVRRELQNVDDRRKYPRVGSTLPVTVYPLHADGTVDTTITGKCKDVSAGGLCFVTPTAVPTKYMYLVFDGVPAVAGLSILARLVRTPSSATGREYATAVKYRTDL